MSKPSLYQVTSTETEAVNNLLKAVVEVNWHLAGTQDTAWSAILKVDENTGLLGVTVNRTGDDPWPAEADSELPE